MNASDYTRYGDYRYDSVLDTMTVAAAAAAASAAIAVVDNVVGHSAVVAYYYLHVRSVIDFVEN